MHPELPYVAFLAAVLVLVPLPWHWRARNVATLSIIAWLFVVNVIYGVDAAIWRHSVEVVVPVWCDITTKILIGANMALPAACMCVCIHLEQVASLRQAKVSLSEKRRRQIIEAVLCFGVPVIWMALHYIVQGHRFDIIEEYGCRPNTYVSVPAIFLIWVPPLALSTISLVYAAMAFNHFVRRRITFAKHLETSHTGLTTSRYLRLMLMSVVLMVIGIVSTSITLWYSTLDLRPWTGWSSVHWNFSRIDLYAVVGTPHRALIYYYAIWLIIPISAFIFFLFFAFGRDALREYDALIVCLRRFFSRRCVAISRSDSSKRICICSTRISNRPCSPSASPSEGTLVYTPPRASREDQRFDVKEWEAYAGIVIPLHIPDPCVQKADVSPSYASFLSAPSLRSPPPSNWSAPSQELRPTSLDELV